MAKIQKLPTGFKASKSGVTHEVIVIEYDLGYYIDIKQDGKLIDRTTRNSVDKVKQFIRKEKATLDAFGGWTIEDFKEVNTKGVDPLKLKR